MSQSWFPCVCWNEDCHQVSIFSLWFRYSDTDDCSTNPCQDKGVCVDGVNTFTCNCASGYTGRLCETSKVYKIYLRVYVLHFEYLWELFNCKLPTLCMIFDSAILFVNWMSINDVFVDTAYYIFNPIHLEQRWVQFPSSRTYRIASLN